MYSIEVKNLEFKYRKDLILKDISFKIKEGEIVSIIGPNGSGKSTLLKNLNNLYTPERGEILIKGRKIDSYKGKDLARELALVPQDTSINYEFTVEDIIMMGRYPYQGRFEREDHKDYKITNQVLNLTNTYKLRDRFITEISGGERQRVIIARALAQDPSIILLDEPTSNLDINHQIEILNLLKGLNKEKNTTVVLVMHDINLAARYSDKIILLHEGRILGEGRPEDVISKENIKKSYNIEVAVENNKYTDTIYIIPL